MNQNLKYHYDKNKKYLQNCLLSVLRTTVVPTFNIYNIYIIGIS